MAGYQVNAWTEDVLKYAEAWQQKALSVLNTLPTKAQNGSAVFSTACFRHCVTDSSQFWNVRAGDGGGGAASDSTASDGESQALSLRDALQAWYFGDTPNYGYYRVVANCSGFRCGKCSTRGLHTGGRPTAAERKEDGARPAPRMARPAARPAALGGCAVALLAPSRERENLFCVSVAWP